MRKVALAVALIVMLWIISGFRIQAQSSSDGYQVGYSGIEDAYLNDRFDSLSIMMNGESKTWSLYANEEPVCFLKKEDTWNCQFVLNGKDEFTAIFDPESLILRMNYRLLKTAIANAVLILKMEDGQQHMAFYPDASDMSVSYKTQTPMCERFVELKGLSHRYAYFIENQLYHQLVEYDIRVDREANRVEIWKNDKLQMFDLVLTEKTQILFLETLVLSHTLDLAYMEKDLMPKSFFEAKKGLYNSDEIDRVLNNEQLVLRHEKSGLTYTVPLRQFITVWKRLGTESYDVNAQETIQTVCQWNEDSCESVRFKYGDLDRRYAVFGSSFLYDLIVKRTETALEKEMRILYRNVSWPSSLWQLTSDLTSTDYSIFGMKTNTGTWLPYGDYSMDDRRLDCEDQFDCRYRTRTFFRKKEAVYRGWSAYDSVYPTDCDDEADCVWQSSKFFNKRTGVWSGYGAYSKPYPASCNDSNDCLWQAATFYRMRTSYYTGVYSGWKSSCATTDSHHCSGYYKYTCKLLLSTNTHYSTTYYSVSSQGPCAAGYKVSERVYGWRYRYLAWTAWSSYSTDICGSSIGFKQCEKETRYATNWRTWQNWSGYNQVDCIVNSMTQCLGPKTFYRTNWRYWTDWTDFVYEQCANSAEVRCEQTSMHAYQARIWSGWSDWFAYDQSVKANDNLKIIYQRNDGSISLDDYPGDSFMQGIGPYWSGETEVSSIYREVERDYALLTTHSLETKSDMTEREIIQLADQVAYAAIQSQAYQKLVAIGGKVLWSELTEAIIDQTHDSHVIQEETKNSFLASRIFMPYIYVKEHYRAVMRNVDISGYDKTLPLLLGFDRRVVGGGSILMEPMSLLNNRNVRVIYYDPKDPLSNHETLPKNWEGHEALLRELREADLTQYGIKIVLNQQDIREIQTYLSESAYGDVGGCGLLKRFKHIVVEADDEIWKWLTEPGMGC